MVQVHTCVSVHCAQCGDGFGSPGFEAHYPTEDAALDAATAAGWVVGPGGRVWCSCCGPVLVCEEQGHEFAEWRPARIEETEVAGGAGGGGVSEYRYCRRCCLHESRAVALLVDGGVGQGETAAMTAVTRALSVGAEVAGRWRDGGADLDRAGRGEG
jgi:hypothetical protein